MLKSIWKGIKWFFSVNEKTHNGINRKRGHVVKQSIAGQPIKVTNSMACGDLSFVDSFKRMQTLHSAHASSDKEDVIESAKSGLWIPHQITQGHKELILANCGFQKTHQTATGMEYDPRLIQAINYAMNMYASEFSFQVETVLQQSSIVE